MNRLVNLLFLILLSITTVPSMMVGQQLTVLGFMEDTGDITAHTQSGMRRDANGNACALVKVRLVEPGATFASVDLIEASELSVNQYLVYLAAGATSLDVNLPGFLSLNVRFADLNNEVSALQSESTYILALATHNDGTNSQYLEIRVSPSDATLEVDNTRWEMRDGYVAKRVKLGNHDYRISAPNYHTEEGRIAVFDANNRTSKTFNLKPAFGKLNIIMEVDANDLTFYVDDAEIRQDMIDQKLLASGEHQLRITGTGFKTYNETFTISDGRITTLHPQLSPEYHYGSAAIESLPIGGARIEIDGTYIGTTPMVYNDLPVGRHRITLSMAGYADRDTLVNVKQGENLDITLTLEPKVDTPEETPAQRLFPQQGANESTSEAKQTTFPNDSKSLVFSIKGVEFVMRYVEGDTFTMGSNYTNADEKPAHDVKLSDYYIGETEVTQALWMAVMGFNPSVYKNLDAPVDNVSWIDCQAFIRNLNAITGITFRLPTEAEWEFAAQGGTASMQYIFAGSNRASEVGWFQQNANDTTHPVKEKKPNELGLYDMTGNVWEWCSDNYGQYTNQAQTNPKGPRTGDTKVVRGGSIGSSNKNMLQIKNRDFRNQNNKYNSVGFRLATM